MKKILISLIFLFVAFSAFAKESLKIDGFDWFQMGSIIQSGVVMGFFIAQDTNNLFTQELLTNHIITDKQANLYYNLNSATMAITVGDIVNKVSLLYNKKFPLTTPVWIVMLEAIGVNTKTFSQPPNISQS